MLVERIAVEIDIEFFYIANLRMFECVDTLDGFSHGREVRAAEANDTLG